MNDKIGLSTLVVRSDEVLVSEIDGEVVMMSIERGTYSGLDAIGSDIWRLLESPRRVSEICDIMRACYSVEQKRCEEDVLAYLHDLASDSTVRVVEPAG